MNHGLWLGTIDKLYCPPWMCPVCRKGTIALRPKSLAYKETVQSVRAHKRDEWDPDWVAYVFTAWAECRHPPCKQEFAICGTGGVGLVDDGKGGADWEEFFVPTQCQPMPEIIELPNKCPDDVANELRSAFSLFWAHPESCAGRIRVALECLMDSLGIGKKKKSTSGQFVDLTLHGRIEAFAKKNAAIGSQLMALKWLGNAGSHDSNVSKQDLLDAFEIMEHALSELIEQRSAKVAALAKKLIKKHGH